MAPPARVDPAAQRAAALVRAALGDGRTAVTVADAAARTGLSLRDAELALHRLLARHRGHLAATERGELVFQFPTGFAIDDERRTAVIAAARATGRALAIATKWLARISLTVFIVGYSLVFAVGLILVSIVASFFAEDGAPLEVSFWVLRGLFEVVIEGVFWSCHPVLADDPALRRERDGQSRTHFHERVNRLFFGPPVPPVDPLAVQRTLAQEIRARRGRIGVGDVMRVTGLRPAAAEAAISRMLVDYDGNVEISDDGVVFYRFDELRITAEALAPAAATRLAPPPAIWQSQVEVPAFTGNPSGSDWKIAAMFGFVGLVGWSAVALELPWYLAEVPAWGAAALAVAPIVRIPSHFARRRAAIRENGRRALLARAHESACEARGVPVGELRDAWLQATGVTIPDAILVRRLIELGGDLVIDDDGNALWRFDELERQMRALSVARTAVNDAAERSPGAIVFRSDDEDDESTTDGPRSIAAADEPTG